MPHYFETKRQGGFAKFVTVSTLVAQTRIDRGRRRGWCRKLFQPLFLLCLMAGTCYAGAPDWWTKAPNALLDLKQPLLRLTAFTFPWFWGLTICCVIMVACGMKGFYTDLYLDAFEVFIAGIFSPFVIIIGVVVIAAFIELSLFLLFYAIGNTLFSIDFDFLAFLLLGLSIWLPAIVILAPLVRLIKSRSLAEKLFGIFATAMDVVGMVLTIWDIIKILIA